MIGEREKSAEFANSPRNKIPQEFTWCANELFDEEKECWDIEIKKTEKDISSLALQKNSWLNSAKDMLSFLKKHDEISINLIKLLVYASLMSDVDLSNSKYQNMSGETENLYVMLSSSLSFMEPQILKIGQEKLYQYFEENKELTIYKKYIDDILYSKKHILSNKEEKILSETGLFGDNFNKASSMLNNVDMPSKKITLSNGKKIILDWASYVEHRKSQNTKDRRKVMKTFWNNNNCYLHSQAAILDGEIKKHYFHAKCRNYSSCLEAALHDKKIPLSLYHNLISMVKKNLTPIHEYLKLKKRALKLDKFKYEDIYAPILNDFNKDFSIKESKELILESLKPLGKEYTEILKDGLNNRWMDIYPNKNKRSGAYSNGSVYGHHPYILLNHNGSFNSVSTMTHELGHAIHSFLSNREQPFVNSHYPIFLAEIASTFNENLLVEHLLQNSNDNKFKISILDNYIEGIRATIYRQTLFAEFELKIHQHVENSQTLNKDYLSDLYINLTREYYGEKLKVIKIPNFIKGEWSAIPHFYYNFYVYQYATGLISAMALSKKVLNGDSKNRELYLNFLKSGCSKDPIILLKETGVNLLESEVYDDAFKSLNNKVEELSKLV